MLQIGWQGSTLASRVTSFPFLSFSKIKISPKIKTNEFRSRHVYPFQLQNSVPLSRLLERGKWRMAESCNWPSWKVITSFWQFSSTQGTHCWEGLPRAALCPTWCLSRSGAWQQWQVRARGPAQSGQGQSLPWKTREAICLLYQPSSPSHLSTAICHDLFMLPLLTASRYSEANFTGSKLSHQLSKAENTAWLLSYISASI